MNEFLSTLPKDKQDSVEGAQSNTTYRFGDGKEAKAVRTIKTPVIIGNKNYSMAVVLAGIPFFLEQEYSLLQAE